MSIRTLQSGEPIPKSEPSRYVNDSGYVRLRWLVGVEEYVEVYEHRFVAGVPSADMHVHHINRVRDDNRRENLVVLTAEEHRLIHVELDRQKFAERRAARGGYRSVSAQQKAERGAARRRSIHERSVRMREMYERGASTTEIGRAFGIDHSRVSVHLRRVGTQMRPFRRSA